MPTRKRDALPHVERLAALLVRNGSTPACTFRLDGDDASWNDAFAAALGRDAVRCLAFVDSIRGIPAVRAATSESGILELPAAAPFGGESVVLEVAFDPESSHFTALVHRTPLERTATDALHRALSLQQATFDATTEGILVTDLEENAVACNRKFIEHFELDAKEIASWTTVLRMEAITSRLIGSDEFAATLDFLREHKDAELPATLRLTGGKVLEMVTRPRRLEGAVIGRVFSFLDVTARVRAETALLKSHERLLESQKNEAVGRLAGGIAHDFNNLLTVIGSYASLIQLQRRSGPTLDDALQQISRATERAAELTRQLLAFGRRQVLEPRLVDLHKQLREAGRMIERVLGDDVELALDLRARSPTVRVDPGQLDQVLLNLAINARDAMPTGGHLVIGTFEREVRPGDSWSDVDLPEGRYVGIRVTDDGAGMPEDVRARVFEPFFTTKEPGKGTGLGLATVHGIVHQSGGRITVASQPGLGTTFRILLPMVEGEAATSDRVSRDAAVRGSGALLVVEDAETVRRLMRDVLEAYGYEVVTAANGEEGFQLASGRRFDLVVTDVIMPRLSGPSMVTRLRTEQPDLKVLYVSGYPAEDARAEVMSSLGAPLLTKPFSPGELVDRVAEALSS